MSELLIESQTAHKEWARAFTPPTTPHDATDRILIAQAILEQLPDTVVHDIQYARLDRAHALLWFCRGLGEVPKIDDEMFGYAGLSVEDSLGTLRRYREGAERKLKPEYHEALALEREYGMTLAVRGLMQWMREPEVVAPAITVAQRVLSSVQPSWHRGIPERKEDIRPVGSGADIALVAYLGRVAHATNAQHAQALRAPNQPGWQPGQLDPEQQKIAALIAAHENPGRQQ